MANHVMAGLAQAIHVFSSPRQNLRHPGESRVALCSRIPREMDTGLRRYDE